MITPLGCVVMVAMFLGVPYLIGRLEEYKWKKSAAYTVPKGHTAICPLGEFEEGETIPIP